MLAVVVAMGLGAAAASRAAYPGANGKIAFVRSEQKTLVWLLDPATGREQRLVKSLDYQIDPQWSPDGKRILFSGVRGIYTANADGTHLRLVARRGHEGSWSPDGRRIVYRGPFTSTSCSDLHILTLSTGRTTRLTATHSCESHPRWSPDGKYIAFTLNDDYTSLVVVMPVKYSPQTQRTVFSSLGARDPNWSPDSTSVAYIVNDRRIEFQSLTGQPIRTIQIYDPNVQEPNYVHDIDFAPDGHSFLYTQFEMSGVTAKYADRLYISALDGSAAKRLTNHESDTSGTWQPVRTP